MKDILEGFKVSSEVADAGNSSKTERRILEACEKMPDNELVTIKQLASRLHLSFRHVRDCASTELFNNVKCKLGVRFLWGNPKTIEKLRKRLANGH